MANEIYKGFIKDWLDNTILPITRGELVLDANGQIALTSGEFWVGLEGNNYGLISKAEHALLTGASGGQSIGDLYNRVEYINEGLKVNGTTLNFYSETDNGVINPTPINIGSTGEGNLAIGVANNVINIALADISAGKTINTTNYVLKNIVVDKFGRVTSVNGGALTNSEIPAELSGKTITNSTLNGCVTSYGAADIGTNAKAVANKEYVDVQIANVAGVATGALHFEGLLETAALAELAVVNANNKNAYYKASGNFTLSSTYVHNATDNTFIKIGDTLIVHVLDNVQKFVVIPSGDDITSITIRKDTVDLLTNAQGGVIFDFQSPLTANVEANTQKAIISVQKADTSHDGYLSAVDWNRFNALASDLSVTYAGATLSATNGQYKIGTLTIGGTANDIYGFNSVSTLSLENGSIAANPTYNPILKFVETGVTDVLITFKGGKGIAVIKNGNNIEFNSLLTIDTDNANSSTNAKASTTYLTLSEDKTTLGVKIGYLSKNGNTNVVNDGLTDYSEFATFRSDIYAYGAKHFVISNSLKDTPTATNYAYGSSTLIAAINVTI